MADSSQQAAPPVEKMAAMTIEKPTGCLAKVECLDAATGSEATEAIYTSELRGSDESGEGTPKVPYKTILQVFWDFLGTRIYLLKIRGSRLCNNWDKS